MEDYGNRFFSEKLEINFQKWKRWAREFLPEDTPQGYKREYTLNDGFHVYLGGYLVSNLKYSIPQTKQILGDISDWLKERVYPEPTREPEGIERESKIIIFLFILKKPSAFVIIGREHYRDRSL